MEKQDYAAVARQLNIRRDFYFGIDEERISRIENSEEWKENFRAVIYRYKNKPSQFLWDFPGDFIAESEDMEILKRNYTAVIDDIILYAKNGYDEIAKLFLDDANKALKVAESDIDC